MYASLLRVFVFFLLTISAGIVAAGHTPLLSDLANSEYNKGKTMLHKQVMCRSCPLGGINLNRDTAPDIMLKLRLGRAALGQFNRKEINAMVAYLEYRFNI